MTRLTEVCEELDRVLFEVVVALDELAVLRAKYSTAVSEVEHDLFIILLSLSFVIGIFLHVPSKTCNGRTHGCLISTI